MSKKKDVEKEEKTQEIKEAGKEKMQKTLIYMQVFSIVLLLVCSMMLFTVSSELKKEAIINPGEGLMLEATTVTSISTDYDLTVTLTNTGTKTAHVGLTGMAYISEMGSATGDEATKVFTYKSAEIPPGMAAEITIGEFTAFTDWHYYLEVQISWNGGTLKLNEMLVPT